MYNNSESVKLLYKVHDYLRDGKAGMSAQTLLLHNLGLPHDGHHPHDAYDLGRCADIMNALPFISLEKMKGVSPQWDDVVDRWNLLMIERGRFLAKYDAKYSRRICLLLDGEPLAVIYENATGSDF